MQYVELFHDPYSLQHLAGNLGSVDALRQSAADHFLLGVGTTAGNETTAHFRVMRVRNMSLHIFVARACAAPVARSCLSIWSNIGRPGSSVLLLE